MVFRLCMQISKNRAAFLRLFHCFFQLRHMPVDFGNHLIGSYADTIQRSLQLRRILSLGPACDIRKAVIRGLDSIVLADGIGNGFCLNLLAVSGKLWFLGGSLLWIDGVQLLVSHFMDCSLDGLRLTHILLNCDSVFNGVEVALRTGCDFFKCNGHRAAQL